MLIVTAEEMRELDRLTIEQFGVPSLTLMERAGEAIAAAIVKRFSGIAKRGVLIVDGAGRGVAYWSSGVEPVAELGAEEARPFKFPGAGFGGTYIAPLALFAILTSSGKGAQDGTK